MAKFWYIPIVVVLLGFHSTLLNIANVMRGQPILVSGYPSYLVFASLGIAVLLEFIYLYLDKEVFE